MQNYKKKVESSESEKSRKTFKENSETLVTYLLLHKQYICQVSEFFVEWLSRYENFFKNVTIFKNKKYKNYHISISKSAISHKVYISRKLILIAF